MKVPRSISSSSLVPRTLLATAQRALEFAAQRVLRQAQALPSRRLQRLASTVLRELALRWPALSDLVRAPGPRDGHRESAAPANGARGDHLAILRGASDFAARARAARALGGVIDADTTSALARALRDPSSEVAVEAAESLSRHGGDVAIAALMTVLVNADGYMGTATRASAVLALGALLPPDGGAAIVAAVADLDATVSLAAIAALAERDEVPSANALLGVLEDRGAFYLPLTRHAAARALGRIKARDVARVQAILEVEADPVVRDALASLGVKMP